MGRKKRGFRVPKPHKLSYSQRFHLKRTLRSIDWVFFAAAAALVALVLLALRFGV